MVADGEQGIVQSLLLLLGLGFLAALLQVDATLFEGFADPRVAIAVSAERAFVKRLDGDCTSPIAAHARISGDTLEFLGLNYDEESQQMRRGRIEGSASEAVELACELADRLLAGE